MLIHLPSDLTRNVVGWLEPCNSSWCDSRIERQLRFTYSVVLLWNYTMTNNEIREHLPSIKPYVLYRWNTFIKKQCIDVHLFVRTLYVQVRHKGRTGVIFVVNFVRLSTKMIIAVPGWVFSGRISCRSARSNLILNWTIVPTSWCLWKILLISPSYNDSYSTKS